VVEVSVPIDEIQETAVEEIPDGSHPPDVS
jgi:hypothetical protein